MTTPCPTLAPSQLRCTIDPQTLGFADTSELVGQPLPWIGQERAFAAARFGLAMDQPDYNLFVLGEVGSGRTSLMRQAMQEAAATRPVPPDLCYLHDFDQPERPRALRLPAGQGRALRQGMQQWAKTLEAEIPKRLAAPDIKAEAERIARTFQSEEARAFSALDAFARERRFRLTREGEQMVFTLLGQGGEAITDQEAQALSPAQRQAIEQAEQELRAEIVRFLDRTRPLERTRDEALEQLHRQTAKPLVDHALDPIRQSLRKQIKDAVKLSHWFDQVQREVLENIDLFLPREGVQPDDAAEEDRRADLADLLDLCRVNLAVDNGDLRGAPVVVEDNPQLRSLFGNIEHQADGEAPRADFSGIHAGSLLRAHGGYLLLFLRDLLGDEPLWERLRRFLRCSRLTIEDAAAHGPGAAVALQPEGVDVDVKIVLVGSTAEYYALQEGDPDLARRFRVKVDFAERFAATPDTRHATAIFIARSCARRGLPHCSAAAVARLLEHSHREADDQARQSALFASTEALLIESAAQARARGATLTAPQDVDAALLARQGRLAEARALIRAMPAKGADDERMKLQAEVQLLRQRWYWSNQRLLTATRYYRLSYQALTHRWRLHTGSQPFNGLGLGTALGNSYTDLADALQALQHWVRWRIGARDSLPADGPALLQLRFRIDLSQLPKPLQIGAFGRSDWNLLVQQTQPLMLEQL